MFFSKGGVDAIIVGLGNPGKEYADTRHNCGFRALDYVSDKVGCPVVRSRFQGLCGSCELSGSKTLLLKPQTFMNLSGVSVAEAARFYKLAPERVIVLVDDVALPCGELRIRLGGSAGGHNGLKSIIEQLASDNFYRIRIGVGANRGDLADYVLGRVPAKERELIDSRDPDILEAAQMLIKGDLSGAQSRFNRINAADKTN